MSVRHLLAKMLRARTECRNASDHDRSSAFLALEPRCLFSGDAITQTLSDYIADREAIYAAPTPTSRTTSAQTLAVAAPNAVVRRPIGDAMIRGGAYANTNFGNESTLKVKASQDPSGGSTRKTLLKFSLAGLQGLAGAKVRIYGTMAWDDQVRVSLHEASSTAWNESTVTWNSAPAAGAKLGEFDVSWTAKGWIEFDVSSLIKTKVTAGTAEVAFVLQANYATSNAQSAEFNSDENAQFQPQLAVTFVAPPTNLAASSDPYSGPVKLTWSDAISNETGFKVYRSADAGHTYLPLDTVGAGITTYTDTTVERGKGYRYRVVALNGASESAPSNPAVAVTQNAPVVRGAIDDTHVRGGAYANTNYATSGLKVKASSVADSSRYSVMKFDLDGFDFTKRAVLRVYGRMDGPESAKVAAHVFAPGDWNEQTLTWNNAPETITYYSPTPITATVTATAQWHEWDVTSLVAGAVSTGKPTISIVLKATNNTAAVANFNSAESAANQPQLLHCEQPTPPAPTNLEGAFVNGQVQVRWLNRSEVSNRFQLYRSDDGGATFQPVGLFYGNQPFSVDRDGLQLGNTYLYRVVAGAKYYPESTPSNTISITLPSPPAVPSNFRGIASGGGVALSWTDNATNEKGYRLWRSDGPWSWSTSTFLGNLPPNTSSFHDTGLVAGKTYGYRLEAYSDYATAEATSGPIQVVA